MTVGDVILRILIVFGVILISMILHEVAHGVVAYALGDRTAKEDGRLSLNPFVHLDWFNSIILPMLLFVLRMPVIGGAKPVPVERRNLKWGEYGMVLVALAGPLTNFLLAFLCTAVGVWTGVLTGANGLVEWVLKEAVFINLGFMAFNLLPIPPLDGSRVLYAILPDALRGMFDYLERYGTMFVFILVMFFSSTLGGVVNLIIEQVLKFILWILG